MTENEKNILKIIRSNPYLTQKEIGEKLNLTRSTVATIISSLSEKKYILGRAYVINETSSGIFCIGGMNVDRKYNLIENLIPNTSNPVNSKTFPGGVGRNIAENLGRLGHFPHLLSLAGFDQDYNFIKDHSNLYVDFSYVQQVSDYSTGSYSAVLNKKGDLEFALADMSVYDQMDLNWIKKYQEILSSASLIVIDLNLPMETINFIIDLTNKNNIDLIVIPVSGPKMKRLPKDLKGVSWIIVNQDESEAYFNKEVNNDEDFIDLANKWISTGVEQVIITRGIKTSIYANKNGDKKLFQSPIASNVIDVTGAGDSFSAGIIHGHLMNYDFEKTIKLGMTNAYYTVQRKETVRLDLTRENLEIELENLIKEGKVK